jgi:hypothetical protein
MTDESAQLGPSYDGTVMLDIGGDRGALILMTPPELLLAEIEVSLVGDEQAAEPLPAHEHDHGHGHGEGHVHSHAHPHRTHVAVRERRGPSGIRYAAIYPSLVEGEYTVWDLDGARAHTTVRIVGGEVTQTDW